MALPADLRDNPTIQKYEDQEGALRALVSAQKFIGGEKLPKPQESWSREQWNAWYQALGRPENPEGYDFGGFAPPEGVPWDGDFQSNMVRLMHEAGLTNDQAKKILYGYRDAVGEQWNGLMKESELHRAESLAHLRQDWGNAFDAKVDVARRAFRHAAGEEYESVAALKLEGGGQIGDDPRFIRLFSRLGESMSEHQLLGPKETRLTMTPVEARSEYNRLMADPDFYRAYTTKEHPEHNDAVQRIHDLIEAEKPEPRPEMP